MISIKENHDITRLTTFGLPASTRWYAEYSDTESLLSLLADPRFASMPRMHIGAGSNLLFTRPYPGLILRSAISGIHATETPDGGDHTLLRAGAATEWDTLVAHTVDAGLYGLENLSAIPGQVGASAIQNVGAYGVEAKDVIHTVHTIDTVTLQPHDFPVDECRYGYRDSMFKHTDPACRYIVTHVTYRLWRTPRFTLTYGPLRQLESDPTLTAEKVRRRVIDIRAAKLPDPAVTGSAGSFFKNPVVTAATAAALASRYPGMPSYPQPDGSVKLSAGWLIEQSGLKGASEGRAEVYPDQCLVIANRGGATANDVVRLYRRVQATVALRFGIELHPEVIII